MTKYEQGSVHPRSRYLQELATLQAQLEVLQVNEKLLRQLTSRFSNTLAGRSPDTDAQIQRLRKVLRDRGNPKALQAVVTDLGLALDRLVLSQADATPNGAAGLEDVAGLLRSLLERIQFDDHLHPKVRALDSRLGSWSGDTDPGELIRSIADLINVQSHGLQDSLLKFEAVFGRINSRLSEMFEHVAEDADAFEASQQSGRALEQQLLGEVTDLGLEVKQSNSLSRLQQQVDQRLLQMESHMRQFRRREEEQGKAFRDRAEHMRERIKQLENQATELEQAMRQEKRKSLVDPLTGIANRIAYLNQAEAYLQRAERKGTPLCLAVWDIDRFKSINDNFGHKAGDRALALVSRKLAKGIRNSDFVARYGGEEFVMLLEDASLEKAVTALNDLRKHIAATRFHHQNEPVNLTISCGVTQWIRGEDLDDAFDRADAALYESKRSGRNRVSSA